MVGLSGWSPPTASLAARTAAWTGLALVFLVDVAVTDDRHPIWPVAVFYAVAAVVVDDRPWRRIGRLARFGTPVVAAAASTIAAVTSGGAGFAPGEVVVLAVLLAAVVRLLPTARAALAGAVTVAVTVSLPARELRVPGDTEASQVLLAVVVIVVVLVAALMAGLYLRTLDARRRDHVVAARAGERTMMAAELHDFVAHHVTGILAQTRMAAMMLDDDPAAVRAVLANIETSAGEALASMRSTVTLLRGEREGAATVDGVSAVDLLVDVGDIDAVAGLVARYGPSATLIRHELDHDLLPAPLQAAAFRVVREGLTNARRHAGPRSTVRVILQRVGADLVVSVSDDGSGHAVAAPTGRTGYGLVGLTERVQALGGVLDHGPNPVHGWTLAARIPVDAS